MYYLKSFSFLTVLIFSLSVLSSCGQEQSKTDLQTEVLNNTTAMLANNNTATTTAEKSEAKVFQIETVGKAEKGKSIDFSWNDNGTKVSFAEYTKNKVVLLNFWGTWCPPCRKEIPDLIALNKELKGKDFVIVGIALERNPNGAVNVVKEYAQKNQIEYINICDLQRKLDQAYGGIEAVPTTFIIDKKGNISETIVGGRDKATFLQSVNRVLK
jgi:thiol-disulfide isomerase/thioredoxin